MKSDEHDEGAPAKIKDFTPKLTDKTLIRIGNSWYASDQDQINRTRLPEEIDPKEIFNEDHQKR